MGKLTSLMIALGTAGTLCLAQGPPAPADDKPAGIEGTVINALTGEPLAHAHVNVHGMAGGDNRNLGAITLADGKFSIANVPAGSYIAAAERTGFTFVADRRGQYGIQIEVRAGDKKDDIKLKLMPTGAISGRVVDAEGEPVEGVSVTAETASIGIRQSANTDDKGLFRIGGLSAGKYRVKATPMNMALPPEIRTDGTVEANYAQTYYPNSRTVKGAGRVEVQAGSEQGGIGIQLVRAPIVGVSGTVAGLPQGAGRVMIELRQGGGTRSAGGVKEDGTFQIWRMDPGKYTISAAWNSNGQRLRTAPVDVEVAESNIEHVELRVVAPSDIAGQVEFEDEEARQAPQSKQQRQQSTQAQPQPRLLNVQEVSGAPSRPSVPVGADGSFRLEAVMPGRYRVVPLWGGVYVKSMRLGQTAIDGNLLDLSSGAAGSSLSVLVSAATAEISGIVRDDKGPVAGLQVVLLAADRQPYSFPSIATTGADGSYRLSALAPGKYKLAAVEAGDFQWMQATEPDDEEPVDLVEIQAGDKLTKDLKQRPPGK